jgi:hypothetical protein
VSGLSLGDRIQLKLIGGDRDKVLLELDSFRDQKPGQRVRVLLRSGRAIEGVVNTASTAHLSLLAIPGGELHQIPAADLARISAATTPSGAMAGTATVLALGAVAGGIAWWAVPSTSLVAVALTGSVVALGTGILRRLLTRRQSWATIWKAPPGLPPAA